MKKIIQEIRKGNMGILLMFMLLAVLTGGIGMAEGAVIGAEGPEPLSKDETHDPADPDSGTGQNPDDDPSGRLAPGDTTAGQNLDGSQASSSQARQVPAIPNPIACHCKKSITHSTHSELECKARTCRR
mgnify:CR=1 FL=1